MKIIAFLIGCVMGFVVVYGGLTLVSGYYELRDLQHRVGQLEE